MKRVANFCKAHGVAKTAIQLAHAGRKASCTPRTTVLGRLSDRWGSGSAPLTEWRPALPSSIPLLTVSTVIVHTIPHLTSGLGYSLALAGVLFGAMTGFQLLGQFVGGSLGDRFNKRLLCVGCMIAHGVGLYLLTYADSLLMVGGFAMLHGIAWGLRGPLMVAIRADYFGPKSFGTITGISSMIVMMGMMSGPIFCGILVDLFGNYEIAFSAIAFTALIGSLCFWVATPPNLTSIPAPSLATDSQRS